MPIPSLRTRHYGHLSANGGNSPKKERRKQLIKTIIIVGLSSLAALFVIGTIVVAWVSRDLPDPNKINDSQVSQSTKIYDRTGTHLLYEIYQNKKRTLVELNQIADYAKEATIAIEDKSFYKHGGIQLLSIVRAGFNNIIGRRSGGGGASTLTQQLIKNVVIGDEHSIFRKIKEAIMAIQLEKKYSKDQILKLYLNEIPYGSTNYGIEAASQSYFHKSAKDLSLPESATLAAMIQAPTRYLNNPDSLRGRRDLILSLMQEQGYITEQEKKDAQNVALRIYRESGPMVAPHFVLYVKQLLADQYGDKTVEEGGLQVITTLDYDKQIMAQDIVKKLGDQYASSSNANNAALVSLDPKTGQVLAMVGSRDYNNDNIDGQFNVAVLGKRQPGSSFKPFVYAAAWEKGFTPDTVLYDVKTNFDMRVGGNYTPKNYDGKEHGLVTMRKALQGSLNIPAVKTLYLVGSKNAIDFAHRFGYTTMTGDYGLSLVLGGAEVNLLEHTNAYATLANDGVYNAPVSILKVTDQNGGTMFEWQPTQGQDAISPELAAMVSGVLSDNNARAYMFGINNNLVLPGRPVAAKTGTTNDSKDAWTLGYTPSLTTGVWVGNTRPSPMKSGGNTLAGAIWNQFMAKALKDTPVEDFPTPPINTSTKPVLIGTDKGIVLNINVTTGKIANSSTPENLISQRTYLPPHDILYYVNKDDPQGPPPADPTVDPQYQNWENALQSWVTRQQTAGVQLTLEDPPTEYDNPQNPALMPTLSVTFPTEGQVLTSRQINIQVNASAPRGVAKVLFYIDGLSIGESSQFPFGLSYYAQKLIKGPHNLKVVAEDDQGNAAQQQINFAMQAELDPPSFDWFDGTSITLGSGDFPRVLSLNPFRWDSTKQISIYLSGTNIASPKLIYTFNQAVDKLFNNQLTFTWQHDPGAGEYDLKGVLLDENGRTIEKTLHITVQD
ncbi:MAG: PBP1A family penicillin-binding protein [Patescibacteria group bacterium]